MCCWCPGCPPFFRFLPLFGQRLLGLDDVARWRLGGGGRILAGRGQLLLQVSNFSAQPRVLLFQLRVAFHHREELFLQLGHALGQPVVIAVAPRFPQLHKAGQYASLAARSRPIGCPANTRILQILGGRLTRRNPLFKITMVRLLSRGSGRHAKGKNPVNGYRFEDYPARIQPPPAPVLSRCGKRF